MRPRIAVTNLSTLMTSKKELERLVSALHFQVNNHFLPHWGLGAEFRIVKSTEKLRPDEWLLAVTDNTDQAQKLGYHDLTKSGNPLGKVFVHTDAIYGDIWTVTASHEVLEMLADPFINKAVFAELAGKERFIAYEVCDPCESDAYSYKIEKISVSNFVLPSWFQNNEQISLFYDYRKRLSALSKYCPADT